jgi:hypothetical protein
MTVSVERQIAMGDLADGADHDDKIVAEGDLRIRAGIGDGKIGVPSALMPSCVSNSDTIVRPVLDTITSGSPVTSTCSALACSTNWPPRGAASRSHGALGTPTQETVGSRSHFRAAKAVPFEGVSTQTLGKAYPAR